MIINKKETLIAACCKTVFPRVLKKFLIMLNISNDSKEIFTKKLNHVKRSVRISDVEIDTKYV